MDLPIEESNDAVNPFDGVVADDGAGGADDAALDPFGGGDNEGGDAADAGPGGNAEDGGAADDPDAFFAGVGGGGDEKGQEAAVDTFSAGDAKAEDDSNSPLKQWEEERKKTLAERAAKARADKEKILEQAEKDIKAFKEKRDASTKKTQASNVAEEKQKRADLAKLFREGDNMWEKVTKMVSLQPKPSRGVDRFRRMLTKLKVEGTQAKSARVETKA